MSGSYAAWRFTCPMSWQEVPKPSLIRSEVDDGYPKVRRRWTKTWREYQATWRIDWSLFDDFRTFYETDCGAGSQPFTMEHPVTGATITVRWKEPPTVGASVENKPVFDVSGTLEMMFA